MPENTLALFGALQLFFNDVAEGEIPAHVAAFVLQHIRKHDVIPLEDVPIADWLSINPKDTNELYSEFGLFCQSIHEGQVNALEATEQIEAVHAHIEQARQRLMKTSLQELGFDIPQIQFLQSRNIGSLEELLTLKATQFIGLRGDRRPYFISTIIEWLRKIPLIPTFGIDKQAA